MADIYQIARQFRSEVLSREGVTASALIEAYGTAWEAIQARLDALTEQLQQQRKSGKAVPVTWLYTQERLQTLQRQVETEIARFARYAEGTITSSQAAAVAAGQEHARQLVIAGLTSPEHGGVTLSWNMVPHHALQQLVGTLGDGSPLRALLDQLPGSASAAVKKALIAGVATGQGPRQIARQIRHALGGDLTRALTISRTEVLRSYRSASIESYRANSDVVQGWQWMATLSERTCAACIAMHGSYHRNDEEFASHICCRCTPIPVTVSWADLGISGIPETRPTLESGDEWFTLQSDEVQQKILGPGKWDAYHEGRITLPDLVGYKDDPQWGPGRFERSLQDAEAAADRKSRRAA